MIKVRRANQQDIPELCRMGLSFYEESGYSSYIDINLDSFIEKVGEINTEDVGAVFVAVRNDVICGMLGCVLVRPWINTNHITAQELFLWVDKDHRNTGAGVALIAEMEKWATDNQCNTISMCCTASCDPERVGRMYQKLCYAIQDFYFIKKVT